MSALRCSACGGSGVLPSSSDPASPSTRDCDCRLPIDVRVSRLTVALDELHSCFSSALKASEAQSRRLCHEPPPVQEQLLTAQARIAWLEGELAAKTRVGQRAFNLSVEHSKRITELESGQRADSGAECREFCYGSSRAGIDKFGCYQIADDGTRHDAEAAYVIKVADSQRRVDHARIAELEATMARVRELPAQWREDSELLDLYDCSDELEAALALPKSGA